MKLQLSYKKVLWFKTPGLENIKFKAFLEAESYYVQYMENKKIQNLNKLILCLFYDRKGFSLDTIEKNAWLLNYVGKNKRAKILDDYISIRNRLKNFYPYAFYSYAILIKGTQTKTLKDAINVYALPDELSDDIKLFKRLWDDNKGSKKYYSARDLAPIITPGQFLPENKFPADIKFISTETVYSPFGPALCIMLPNGEAIDTQNN